MSSLQILAMAANGAFVLAELVVGVRLLALWRRTGRLPEAMAGAGLLLICAGFPVMIAGGVGRVPSGELSLEAVGVGLAAIGLGITALNVFTWKVFRPHARWGAALALGTAAAAAAICAGSLHTLANAPADADPIQGASSWWMALRGLFQVWYVWTGVEALSEYTRARRRLALGLSDVVVANRLLLWGAMGTLGAANNVVAIALEARGLSPVHDPSAALVLAVNGVGMAVLMVLTLMPPRAYVEFIRGRAELVARA